MKTKPVNIIFYIILGGLLAMSCKKQLTENQKNLDANASALINQPPGGIPTIPDTIKYVGDLSVSISSSGTADFDSCSKTVKKFFNVIVANTNGNNEFTFDLKFIKNGVVTAFYDADGTNIETGKVRVINLRNNEVRDFFGYIETPYIAPNPEINTSIQLEVQIAEIPTAVGNIVYKIRSDVLRTNNSAKVQTTMPYFVFQKTGFDDLDLVAMQSKGEIYGYQARTKYPHGPGYALFAADYNTPNSLVTLDIYYQLSPIYFVKAGCLPVSGKPFYYLKYANKYLTGSIIKGLILTDATANNEVTRRWMFMPATGTGTTGTPGANYFIYNMGFGPNFSLEVKWSDELNTNFIGVGTPNISNRLQVFSIKFK